MPKVAILGAGIAGLSAGWLLQERGISHTILEKQSYTGGLARSFMWKDFPCDFAAHRLFTTDEHVLKQMLNLVPMGRHIRRSRIYLHGRWMRDPMDLIELVTRLSPLDNMKLLWSYLTRPRNLHEDSFENFVLKRYGRSLYDLFFRPYTEKLFGIPGNDISVFWSYQKVRLSNPLDNFRENTKTKFQYFYYPIHGGYGAIAEHLYREIKDNVVLEATVKKFIRDNGKLNAVVYEKDGEEHTLEADIFISTLPITITARMLDHPIQLRFQKVEAVYLHLNKPYGSDYHWVYFMDEDISINRMVEFKNMSQIDKPKDTTVLCAEVTQQHNDVTSKVVDDLVRIGFIKPEDVLDTKVIRENYSYPVYNRQYDQILKEGHRIFDQYNNLYLLGRAAEFHHREVDDNFAAAVERVKEVSERILGLEHIELEKEAQPMPSEKSLVPDVIVVILTYNHFDDTKECLESVYKSKYERFKVILVDNGSTDRTPEKVRQQFPDVILIENKQNLGVPGGYNVGFRHALEDNADYILMLNNDTVILPDMMNKLVIQAEQDQNIGMVMPKVLYHGTDDQVWSSGGRYRSFPPAILMTTRGSEDQLRTIEYAPSCALLISARTFKKAGLFDPGYFFMFDDWDFSERVRAHGFNIVYYPDAYMWHKVSRTTKGPQSSLFWKTYGASIVRFYRRHGRPVWLSLPLHVGYVILREFFLKGNWKYWSEFRSGMKDGLQKPLGGFPMAS